MLLRPIMSYLSLLAHSSGDIKCVSIANVQKVVRSTVLYD